MQELGLSDGMDCPDRLKNGSRDFAIHADEGNGVGPALGFAAAEGERCDVDSEFAESRADLADDTGFVAISQIQYGALKLGLQRNSFDLQHARRTVMENSAFGCKARRRTRFLRQRRDFQSIWEAVFAPSSLFFHSQAARRGHCRGIHDIYFFVQHRVKDASQHSTAKQMRAHLRYLSF